MDAAMVVTTDLYPATSNPFIRLLPPRLSSRLGQWVRLLVIQFIPVILPTPKFSSGILYISIWLQKPN